MRLLTEPEFVEEFDTIVDEMTYQYVHGEIEGDDRKRLEDYFLKARERKLKGQFASVLIDHAAATRTLPKVPAPTLFERLAAFFSPQSMAFKFATTAAVLVLAVGIAYFLFRGDSTPRTFQAIELSIASSDRAVAAEPRTLRLAPDTEEARLLLNLPGGSDQYRSYRVDLVTRDGVKTPLTVIEQNPKTVTVTAPVSLLQRGSYGVELTGIKADGTAEPLRGTFYFNVE